MRVTLAALAFILLVILVIGLAGPLTQRLTVNGRRQIEPFVGAHYYPWYDEQRWTGQPATDTPKLGRYSSADRTVVAEHIRWARQADLDFFMLSCLDPHGREAKTIRESVLPELEKSQFRFALHYETPIALGVHPQKPIDLAAKLLDGTVAGDRFIEHFDYLAETYLKHPQYLLFRGQAVVMLYLVRNMENAGPYLKTVRERLAARGIDLYLIADVMYWEKPGELDWPFLKEHFQAVTAYNMYDRPDFLPSVEKQFEATDRAARTHEMRLIPNVMPGYDDTRLRGAGRVTLARRGGEFYRDYWKIASPYVRPDQPFLLITTFNEWHEGAEIEPSAEYGDLYLNLTRELIADMRKR